MSKSEGMVLGSLTSSSLSSKVHPSNDPPELDPDSYALEKFKLYETRAVKFNFNFNFFTDFRFINLTFID